MKVCLVKPPELTDLNFGDFSLAALASYIFDVASVRTIDATELSIVEAVEKTLSEDPDLIGVTAMSLESVQPVCEFVLAVRNYSFDGLLVAGGHGAAMRPEPLLNVGVDAVVFGEGEKTLRELVLSGLTDSTQGVVRFIKNKIVKTAPRSHVKLDQLRLPFQRSWGDYVFFLETSRGCPHNCRFCEATQFHRTVWRSKNPERVVKDIDHLVQQGASIIHIVDDNFTADPTRVVKICDFLKDKELPLFFIFSARSDDLVSNDTLIPKMAESHFLRANVGVETVDPELSRRIGKKITPSQHEKAFKALRASQIFSVASFIVGLPGEPQEIDALNLEFAVNNIDVAQFVPFQPLPGISLGDGSGTPEKKHVDRSIRLKREYDGHSKVLDRLLKAAEQSNIRGLLARETLSKRLIQKTLNHKKASYVKERLELLKF